MKNFVKMLVITGVYSVLSSKSVYAQLQINPISGFITSVEKGSSFGDGMWGGGVTVRYFINPRLAVGVNGRYFSKSSTFYFGTELVRSRNNSIMVTGQLEYFLTQRRLRPYIGVESGLYADRSRNETSGRPTIHYAGNYFGGAPKIGFQYSIIPTIGINLDAGYHFIVDGNTPSKSLLLSGGVFFTVGSK